MDHSLVIVPGIGGSGPGHWQSHWQEIHPDAVRIAPASWDLPGLPDWIAALERAVAGAPAAPVVAVASSDDPHDLAGRGIAWARARGAEVATLGPRGHLNAAAGLGDWPEGQALLAAFLRRCGG